MTVSADWTAEYRGLAIGDGTPFDIARVEGLLDLPLVRSGDRLLLSRDGAAPGTDRLGPRTLVLTLEVFGDTDETFAAAVADLTTATAPSRTVEYPLTLQIPGVAGGAPAFVKVRPRNRSLPIGLEFLYRSPLALVELVATDPLIYSDSETAVSIDLAADPGGRAYDRIYPMVYAGGGSFGSALLTNAGSADAPATLRINGPVTNPEVRNVTTGQSLGLTIVLDAGEFLDIDTQARTVLLGGTANRYSALTTPQWWSLQPGVNEVRYLADISTASTVDVTFRSAWV